MNRPATRAQRQVLGSAVINTLLVLGCGTLTVLPVTNSPRWACPSVTPVPTRVKEVRPLPTPTPGYEEVFYEMWEQEHGLPPHTPTPYSRSGNSYFFGQRVEVRPLHALVTATAAAHVGDDQLFLITIRWLNRASAPLAMDYGTHVRLTAVRASDGRVQSSDRWGLSGESLEAAGIAAPPAEVPLGESEVRVPILAPPGTPETVSVLFTLQDPSLPSPPGNAGAASQPGEPEYLTVHWSAGSPEPPCTDAGVVTDWGDGPPALPEAPRESIAVRVVQIALNQVGKPYIWGAKGPNAFDCSGLTQWSYAQVGIRIPAGTAGQWPGLPGVEIGSAQPGDLIFFDTLGQGRITHVGMLTGDLDGDGAWDMVHAASPELGVRTDYRVMQSTYFRSRYRGIRLVVR